MSVKHKTNHEESIYDILRKSPPPEPKPPRYISTYHNKKQPTMCKTSATMGIADISLNDPTHYLKKGEGIKHPSAEPHRRCLTNTRLPRLPEKDAKDSTERKSTNFIVQNVKSAKRLKPKSADKYIIDSPNGHKFLMDDSNLKYVYGKKFGSSPHYLTKRKQDIQRAEDDYKRYLETKEPLCKLISEEERQQILNGLKENWAKVQKSLQLLPLMIDTIVKVNKKKKIEDTLNELERNIRTLENNPYIYVYDDE